MRLIFYPYSYFISLKMFLNLFKSIKRQSKKNLGLGLDLGLDLGFFKNPTQIQTPILFGFQ
jgi:hypothetical protein